LDRAQQRKAAELLIRRGFGGDQIRAATRFDPDE
jgi:regulatory protein